MASLPRAGSGTADGATATWYGISGNNDSYWRVSLPAKAIGAKLCLIPLEVGKKEIEYPSVLPSRTFRWIATNEGSSYPDHEGAAVFTRPDNKRGLHALAMKELHDVRIVAECDDNYLSPVKFNPYLMEAGYDEEKRRAHLTSLCVFDAVIFSTDWLADRYDEAFRRLRRGRPDIRVVGNHVDPDDWPLPIPSQDGRLRIGWMGSPSHVHDLALARPALEWASRAGHDVRLIGHNPEWDFPFRYTPWRDPREYGRPALPLDILVAPLQRNEFTLGKSDVKALEAGVNGCAFVGSQVVYGRSLVHRETALLACSPDEFTRHVQTLVRDPTFRKRLAENLSAYVRENRLIGQHRHEWMEAVTGDSQACVREGGVPRLRLGTAA